jgi:Spy/CpxP family protein refolding chaperone
VTRRAYLYFVLTFLLGVIAGGAGMYDYVWHSGHWHQEYDQKQIVKRMTKELSLDEAQVQKLTQILDDSTRKRREIEQANEPQFDALRQATRNQIRQILNPDQLARFNEHVRQSDERRKKQKSS